jgi:hypothetical protein
MKQFKISYLFFAIVLLTVFTSCRKTTVGPKKITDTSTTKQTTPIITANGLGLYVLNYGVAYETSGSLTYYDYTSNNLIPDLFSKVNGTKLGGNGLAIGVYGSKIYLSLSTSGLHVLDIKTSKQLEKDSIGTGNAIAFYKNNILLATGGFSLLSVIDTTSYNLTNNIITGDGNIDQMLIVNNKLYVLNANIEGVSIVTVLDPSSLKVIKSIEVSGIATIFAADVYGHIYVPSSNTDFHSGTFYGGGFSIIDDVADTVKSFQNIAAGEVFVQGDFLYYSTTGSKIVQFNTKTQTIEQANFITDGTVITTPYAISGNPTTGEIFISDIKDGISNGTLFAFDKTGKKEYSFTTGINPYNIALISK